VLSDVVRLLACPVCRQPMSMDGAVVRCRQGHCFDVARQGHLNLTADRRPASPGDSAEMVAARARFLEAGHYSPFADAVSAKAAPAATVLDLGAGTGWYLARVLDGPGPQPDAVGIALDISPYAARRAARCHPRVGAVVADTWGRLPVLEAAVDVVLVVFAPRHAAEVHRVLRPGGRFHFLEHGLSPDASVAKWQRRFEPVQKRVADGCHLTRDAAELVRAAGFEVEQVESRYAKGPKPWTWLTAGTAIKPG
jgi:23S rRNA (guanine745-N1)-methyltransferase